MPFIPVVTTTTTTPINIGATILDVVSTNGFEIGMVTKIGSGNKTETFKIIGFGSLIIDEPIKNYYPIGTTITGYISNVIIPSITPNTYYNKPSIIKSYRILNLRNNDDILNGLIGSTFRLRVNLPSLNTYLDKTNTINKTNYFYLGVEKIDPNCNILTNSECLNIFVDDKNCNNKKASQNSQTSNYRYVLIPEIIGKDTSLPFINNLNFTLENNNNKLYLNNINTKTYPKILKDDSTLNLNGNMLNNNKTNINTVNNQINNKLCNSEKTSIPDKFNLSCSYYSDPNIRLITTSDNKKCSPVHISINDINTINLDINMYNIYGTIKETFSLISDGINVENITRNNTSYKVNMIELNSDISIVQNNKLNFNVEIINFSNKIYESNLTDVLETNTSSTLRSTT